MTQLMGINLNNRERLIAEEVDLKEIANVGANAWIEMIFRDSFFHADPHPGNLLVLLGGRVGILDCGMVGYIDDNTRTDLEDLALAFSVKDVDQISNVVLRICDAPRSFQRKPFTRDVDLFMADYLDQSISDMNVSDMMQTISEIAFRHHLVVPANLVMLGKTVAMLEGTSHLVDPNFDLNEVLRPHYRAILERRYSPKRFLGMVLRSYKDWERLITSLPGDVGDVLALMQQGEFNIQFEVKRIDRVINRLIYGLVVASLIMASGMIWSAGVGPMAGDISLLGATGIIFSIVLMFRLFRAIERSGGL